MTGSTLPLSPTPDRCELVFADDVSAADRTQVLGQLLPVRAPSKRVCLRANRRLPCCTRSVFPCWTRDLLSSAFPFPLAIEPFPR